MRSLSNTYERLTLFACIVIESTIISFVPVSGSATYWHELIRGLVELFVGFDVVLSLGLLQVISASQVNRHIPSWLENGCLVVRDSIEATVCLLLLEVLVRELRVLVVGIEVGD